jgi:hypothetical protein
MFPPLTPTWSDWFALPPTQAAFVWSEQNSASFVAPAGQGGSHWLAHPFIASETQDASHPTVQQVGSTVQTYWQHAASEHEGVA